MVEYLSSDAQTSEGSLNPGTYKLTAYIGDAYQKSDKGKPIDVSAAEEIQDISFDVVLTGSGVVGGRQEFSYDQLKNGADFGKLAKKHSICPSGKRGGDLGEFRQGQMVPAFDKVVFSCPELEPTGPLHTQFGYHIIKVLYRK